MHKRKQETQTKVTISTHTVTFLGKYTTLVVALTPGFKRYNNTNTDSLLHLLLSDEAI